MKDSQRMGFKSTFFENFQQQKEANHQGFSFAVVPSDTSKKG
ncbi:hypothetical protein RU94_GL001008 [Enterococcus asini]|nr:hypothetical protein [Enterococcus asini]OJG13398.1 hypothetical protein RU94_GL001008 [Enterococcus asini]